MDLGFVFLELSCGILCAYYLIKLGESSGAIWIKLLLIVAIMLNSFAFGLHIHSYIADTIKANEILDKCKVLIEEGAESND